MSKSFINDTKYHDCEQCIHVSSGWGDLAKCSLDEWHYCINHQKPYFRERNKSSASDLKDPRTMPLNQCLSLGDLMYHMEQCKALDKKDQQDSPFLKDNEFEV